VAPGLGEAKSAIDATGINDPPMDKISKVMKRNVVEH